MTLLAHATYCLIVVPRATCSCHVLIMLLIVLMHKSVFPSSSTPQAKVALFLLAFAYL
jgi:hypothetical protein